jgi:hypothetical protein
VNYYQAPSQMRDPATSRSRRAFFEAHGRWPRPGDILLPRYTVTFTRAAPDAPPAATPAATPVPFRTPEQIAWERAYSGPEVGPAGGSWPDDGRHVPRMVWRLPYNSAR